MAKVTRCVRIADLMKTWPTLVRTGGPGFLDHSGSGTRGPQTASDGRSWVILEEMQSDWATHRIGRRQLTLIAQDHRSVGISVKG